MPRPRLFGVLVNIGQSLLSLNRKADWIMSQIDDLKAADAAEASAVTAALAELKMLSDQHAADLAALATKPQLADDPELATLLTSLTGRAASLNAGIAALHGTVSATSGTEAPAPVVDPAPAAEGATSTTEHTETTATGTAGA